MGCTYSATSQWTGGYPAGTYIDSIPQSDCTLTTTTTSCQLDCSSYNSNANLDLSNCAININDEPWGANGGTDISNQDGTLTCAPLTSSNSICEWSVWSQSCALFVTRVLGFYYYIF